MASKITEVKLTNGVRFSWFELQHAEKLLNWRGSGWSLADERYELTEGLLTRRKKK